MAQTSRRNRVNDHRLILRVLIIVFLVIFIFEGRFIYILFTFRPSQEVSAEQELSTEAVESAETNADASSDIDEGISLAGILDTGRKNVHPTVANPDSPSIVKAQSTPVDDSYFSDAVFIGDSRMEGFRNSSGITTGTFFTSVGMSLTSMTNQAIISTSQGSVTVPAALSGGTYGKIYVMFGANDLGTYDWEEFEDGFISVMERFRELQPEAVIYVCSCIYVEESKVTTGSYVNNENVDTLNAILLEVCEEDGYQYLNLNEIFSDGSGSLISDASSDGIHLNQEYCESMLNYMKTHYISIADEEETELESESESVETEPESESESEERETPKDQEGEN